MARELVMGSQPSEYLARSGVAGGSVFGQGGEYPGNPGVSFGSQRGEYLGNPGVSFSVHANQSANPFMNISPISDVSPYRFENPFVQQQPQSKLPDHVVNEYARLGIMGFCVDDERVTITRRELNEYVQSRKHAETC